VKQFLVLLAVLGSASLGIGCFGDNTASHSDAGLTFDAGLPGLDAGVGADADASVPLHDAAPTLDAQAAAEAGPTPQASLSASAGGSSTSDFGLEQIGQSSASATVIVSNTGTAATGVLAVTLAGPNAAEFAIDTDGCSGKTLAPSTTCTVSVHFAPTTAGQATAALAASATPGGSTSISLAGQGVTPGALSITPATKDFGSFGTGVASPAQTFTVRNSGGTATLALAVAVNGTNASDFAISASTCTGPIAAGDSCTLNVAFTPSAAGTRTASLAATAGSSVATASLSGTGLAPATFTLAPTSWTFPPLTVGTTSAAETFTLTNTGGDTSPAPQLGFIGANAADFTLSSNPCPTALTGGAGCTFTVSFTPSLAGAETATLGATATGTGAASSTLSGTGLSPGVLAILPQGAFTGNFGPVSLTQSATASFVLQNNGQSTLVAVPTVSSNGGDFEVNASGCTTALAPGANCPFSVMFAPSATGSESAVITASAGTASSTYDVAGTGAVPLLAVTPPTGWTGFGTVDVGSTNSATFTVTNTGLVATVAAPMVTSSNTTQFHLGAGSTPCTSPLAPAGTCNFVLTFAPTAVAASDTTTLTASVTPGTSVPYTASGSATVSTLAVTGTPFGYVTLGQSATLTYTVKNNGPYPVSAPTVSSSNADFVVTASCGALAVNGSCNFTVTFKPSTTNVETAIITASAPPNNAGTYTATGQGAVGALAAISAWTAPPTVQGKSNGTTFTIVNNGHGATDPLSISGVTAGTGIFNLQADNCTGKSLAPNGAGTCTFQVFFAPTTTNSTPGQTASATVTVTDTTTDTTSASVSGIPLYSGVWLVISPATASYGNLASGASPSLPFTITNYGTNPAPPFSSIRVVSGTNETPSIILYDVANATTANCPMADSTDSPAVAGLASLASCNFSQPFDYGQTTPIGAFSFSIYPTAYNYTSLGGPGAVLSGVGQ
jgi:hypothetical protein